MKKPVLNAFVLDRKVGDTPGILKKTLLTLLLYITSQEIPTE